MLTDPKDILKQYWGYDDFRASQRDIITSVLNGNDTLAVLPTGGGKSITYQIPSLAKEGLCIVISPLLSLIKDQNESLLKRDIKSIALTGGMHYKELDIALDNCVYGAIKFLFVSPERLKNTLVLERIKRMNVNLVAIDEAHCISQWGYDFRPSYLELSNLKDILPNTPFLALTASATPKVIEDIQVKLKFKNPTIINGGIERKNLSYNVLHQTNKRKKLLELLTKHSNESGIIYAHTRKDVRELAEFIIASGFKADFYHAGLSSQERIAKQNSWQKNKLNILVATTAFGMGIDKPDVRYVIHFDIPGSIESYYQETGRAGRDNDSANAYLIHNDYDIDNYINRIEQSLPDYETIKRIYQGLANTYQLAIGSGEGAVYDFDVKGFANKYNISLSALYTGLNVLERQGYISTNTGFYESSKLLISVPHQELYHIQVVNPEIDNLLKTLLRSYAGLFEDFMKIDESKIAKRLNWTEEKVRRLLRKLDSQEMVNYIERTDSPKIVFEQARVDVKYLKITKEYLRNRIEQTRYRMDSVIDYLKDNKTCRSIQLATYFGFKQTKQCGICDVCKVKS